MQARITTGTLMRPALIHRMRDAWLIRSPKASSAKSTNMKSTTGRAPAIAAPTHMVENPRSQIGVSRSRSGPCRLNKPVVVLKFPPRSPIPSPTTKMVASRSISCASAERAAST